MSKQVLIFSSDTDGAGEGDGFGDSGLGEGVATGLGDGVAIANAAFDTQKAANKRLKITVFIVVLLKKTTESSAP